MTVADEHWVCAYVNCGANEGQPHEPGCPYADRPSDRFLFEDLGVPRTPLTEIEAEALARVIGTGNRAGLVGYVSAVVERILTERLTGDAKRKDTT